MLYTGPAGQARVLPWVIDSVFLFQREELLAVPTARGVKIGAATSVRKAEWEAARVFQTHGYEVDLVGARRPPGAGNGQAAAGRFGYQVRQPEAVPGQRPSW